MAITREELADKRRKIQEAQVELAKVQAETAQKVEEADLEYESAQMDAEYERVQNAINEAKRLSENATAVPTDATSTDENGYVVGPKEWAPEGFPAPSSAPTHDPAPEVAELPEEPINTGDSEDEKAEPKGDETVDAEGTPNQSTPDETVVGTGGTRSAFLSAPSEKGK
jgi:hypothetical protein